MFRLNRNERSHWSGNGVHVESELVFMIGRNMHHRHRGLDFTIITQHPNLIHANIRRLVGRHIHVRRTALGVMVYEWSECKASPDTAFKSALTKVSWSHPKSSFGLYKSASIHQKVKFRIPKALWLVIVPLVLMPFIGWAIYDFFSKGIAPPIPTASTAPAPVVQSSPFAVTGQSSSQQQSGTVTVQPAKPVDDNENIKERFIPRIYGEPATAPAYDNLRSVVTMPVVAACIADADRCWCYTQQMTKVDMTETQCRERVARGEFDPYRDAAKPREVRGESTTSTPHTET
ncbi:zonular occludens toxin domain-containing protein [Aeromonas hydrophila]|uniref:zonular occludens toxin domain-containing protein n=1 Tax=Aeromonas hydrophila TaxID=644 RepID=UPI000D25B62D|nr:zonular occludens toxin domain-containing protein [Aeromonas hydrophila]AWA06647.1 hypothetical protein C1A23_13955 [Aeromonas hydrophila subsp. hydrophila]